MRTARSVETIPQEASGTYTVPHPHAQTPAGGIRVRNHEHPCTERRTPAPLYVDWGTEVHNGYVPDYSVHDVELSPCDTVPATANGTTFATGRKDGMIRVWQ